MLVAGEYNMKVEDDLSHTATNKFTYLPNLCKTDADAFSLHLTNLVHGSINEQNSLLSVKLTRSAKKRLTAYLTEHKISQTIPTRLDPIVLTLEQLQRIDFRLPTVFFAVQDLFGTAWKECQPLESIDIDLLAMAKKCGVRNVAMAGLLRHLEGIMFASMELTKKTQARLVFGSKEETELLEGCRQMFLSHEKNWRESSAFQKRMSVYAGPYMSPDDQLFEIDPWIREQYQVSVKEDCIRLITMFNEFASGPDRNVSRYNIPKEYLRTGIIRSTITPVRAVEDWIISENLAGRDLHQRFSQVLEIADTNQYLKGLSFGTLTDEIEGEEDDWSRKDQKTRYGAARINLAWFFQYDWTHPAVYDSGWTDNMVRNQLHIDMVLEDHYLPFTHTGMPHLYDALTVEERKERLGYVIDTYNAMAKKTKTATAYWMDTTFFDNPYGATGSTFLSSTLEWTMKVHDWRKTWDRELTILAGSPRKHITIFDAFQYFDKQTGERLKRVPKPVKKNRTPKQPVPLILMADRMSLDGFEDQRETNRKEMILRREFIENSPVALEGER